VRALPPSFLVLWAAGGSGSGGGGAGGLGGRGLGFGFCVIAVPRFHVALSTPCHPDDGNNDNANANDTGVCVLSAITTNIATIASAMRLAV
jgi:hypothetical protein